MHGQKKRRKRTMAGTVTVDRVTLEWRLLSEPQWTSEDGYRGLCISVRVDDGHRELVLQFPLENKFHGHPDFALYQLPQRPKFSDGAIEAGVRQAMTAGWDPGSRGKTFVHHVIEKLA